MWARGICSSRFYRRCAGSRPRTFPPAKARFDLDMDAVVALQVSFSFERIRQRG